MTSGSGETVQLESTPDEAFAGHFKRQIEAVGYHVEYGGDTQDDVTTYYALVVSQKEYDRLVEEQNQQAAAKHAAFYRHTSGPKPAFQVSNLLDWEATSAHPMFSAGHVSREDALVASAAPLFKD